MSETDVSTSFRTVSELLIYVFSYFCTPPICFHINDDYIRQTHTYANTLCDLNQMQPMNHNSSMESNTMNALAQMNQMNDMQQGNNPMAKMQGMANGYV